MTSKTPDMPIKYIDLQGLTHYDSLITNKIKKATEDTIKDPLGGQENQVLTKTATGYEWRDSVKNEEDHSLSIEDVESIINGYKE